MLLIGASVAIGYLTGELATATRDSIAGAASMTKKGTLITGSHNVFINGCPTAMATDSMAECADNGSQQMAENSSRVFINGLHAARIGDQTTLPDINRFARICLSHGCANVSGQKFLSDDDELDFVLPSRLPVRWQRCWRSGNPDESVLGRGWSLFWKIQLARCQDALVWRASSGDYISFPQVPPGQRTFCEAEKYWLEHHQDNSWSVYDISGERWHFGALPDDVSALPQRLVCHYADNRLTGA